MSEVSELSRIDLPKLINELMAEVRTLTVTFTNNTTAWDVDWWAYELRQTQNLPPPSGYVDRTGVVVGGTKNQPGQAQTAYMTVKVIANFADCGLVNLHNRVTGKIITAWNFPDLNAPEGRYYANPRFGIKDGAGFSSNEVFWEFDADTSDGLSAHFEGRLA